jgi:hypothetical protein
MKVYFHDNVDSDQRLPHEGTPATSADLEKLGVYASNITEQAEVDRIAKERGYRNRDEVCAPSPYPALSSGDVESDLWKGGLMGVGQSIAGVAGGKVSHDD